MLFFMARILFKYKKIYENVHNALYHVYLFQCLKNLYKIYIYIKFISFIFVNLVKFCNKEFNRRCQLVCFSKRNHSQL